MLTALDGVGGHLEGDVLSSWLRDVHAEHQANARVLPTHVRLALPQLDVGVPELQDPDAVDSVKGGGGGGREHLVSRCGGVVSGGRRRRGARSRPHSAFMLFFGSRGISRTLVPWTTFSKLVVVTVFPVMRWTW